MRVTISRMRRHAPFEPIDPKSCMWGGVTDVINCANFCENRSKGLGAGTPRKTAFPIESVHRPYNSVSTTVLHCDNAIFRTLKYTSFNGYRTLPLLLLSRPLKSFTGPSLSFCTYFKVRNIPVLRFSVPTTKFLVSHSMLYGLIFTRAPLC